MILCIDPGLRGCGVAFFEGAQYLYRAEYVKNTAVEGRGYDAHRSMAVAVWNSVPAHAINEIIIEHPVYYGSKHEKGDPNDLLDVVAVGAAIAAKAYHPEGKRQIVTTRFPRDWKGQVPKEIMTERIKASLTQEELDNVIACRKDLLHNVYDAVGIGLHALGRLNKRKYAND